MTRDDKPTVPRFSAVLPAEAARPVEFSPSEVELAVHVLEALCEGERPHVMPYQRPPLLAFVRKLRAIGLPPLDPSELRDEGDG